MAEVPPQTVLLTRLAKSLAGEKAAATFACGGTIVSKLTDIDDEILAPEIPILFYEDKKGQCHKITFPGTPEEMEKLSSECDPASFGVGTEERLDTDYRSAWKLDNTKFATSFHPFDSDIMDVVKQLLFAGAIHLGYLEPIIVAELYKLNVYMGPHDQFKPHVDTPRAELQFGSLVVCLPSAHKGGELVVRHDGREVKFDWSKDSTAIQWAAFYSDCEHEVLPVTEGYRVTLTYNLFYNTNGHQVPASPNWQRSTLPLFQVFSEVLQSKDFMPNGGVLGVYCHHTYAHAANNPNERLPQMLKGVDAAMAAVCAAYGLETQARPVYLTTAAGEAWSPSSLWYRKLDRQPAKKNGDDDDDDSSGDERGFYPDKYEKPANKHAQRELNKLKDDPVDLFNVKATSKNHLGKSAKVEWVGENFHSTQTCENLGDYEEWLAGRLDEVNWVRGFGGIHWLNKARHREGNMAYLTYGNEAGVGMLYSAAAMFILVPKWDEMRGVKPSQVIKEL